MDPAKSDVITQEMIDELTHRVIHDPVGDGEAEQKLTENDDLSTT